MKKLFKKLIIICAVMTCFAFFVTNKKVYAEEGDKPLVDGKYVISSAINEKIALDVSQASKNNLANIQVWTYVKEPQQQFNLKYNEDGTYTITASHSNKALDVACAGKTDGTNVQQYESNGTNAQRWIIKDAGSGYYYIISKCNNLYLDVVGASAKNGTNVWMYTGNGTKAQKFKFTTVGETPNNSNNGNTSTSQPEPTPNPPTQTEEPTSTKTIENGLYTIRTKINSKFALDVSQASKSNGANIQLWEYVKEPQQQFNVSYNNDGTYTIAVSHSKKVLDVVGAGKTAGTNVQQYESNGTNAQKWIIKDAGDGYYYVISKCNNLYLDVCSASGKNGTNIWMYTGNGTNAQKFKFDIVNDSNNSNNGNNTTNNTTPPQTVTYTSYTSKYLRDYNGTLDETKYPGYQSALNELLKTHPNWKIKLLVIGRNFTDITSGECKVHSRNLVPSSTSGEWVCPTCGTRLYDSGWYCASEKAVAYYMDPRNFMNEKDIFQFMDINTYVEGAYPTSKIQQEVNGTFLEPYAEDITTACRNQGVNPLFVIARLFQENGRSGSSTTRGLKDSDGKVYYNPFNIGASGNGVSQILANALAKAKAYGWDTMEKAIEGGILFCKANWLENCQNTLYLNKFDIDDTNGSSLYSHQYMQNLMAAYSEGRTMYSMIKDFNSVNSAHTFIIPVYENINAEISGEPNDNVETYLMNVEVTGTDVRFRSAANTNSTIIEELAKGTILLSMQRGINSDWQYVVKPDGTAGYVSGAYLKQVNDVTTCNIKMKVKTNDGGGVNVRLGPGTNYGRVTTIADNTEVTVIDNTTYSNLDGNKWFRVILPDGKQSFISGNYLVNSGS